MKNFKHKLPKLGINQRIRNKIKQNVTETDIMIELKLVRVVKNSTRYYRLLPEMNNNLALAQCFPTVQLLDKEELGKHKDVKEYNYNDYDYEYQMPNGMVEGDVYRREKKLFFESLEVNNYIEGRLGTDDEGNKNTPCDFKWLIIENGFIGYKNNEVYFLEIEVKRTIEDNQIKMNPTFKDVHSLNFELGNLEVHITSIHESSDPSKVILVFSNNTFESLIVVWDLFKNSEYKNYSVTGSYKFISGKASEIGYLLCEK